MLSERHVRVSNLADWNKFLEAISKINESAILEVKQGIPGLITSLVSSPDNTLLLYSELETEGANFNGSLNIPDLKKLSRVMDSVQSGDIIFIVNNNNIEYKGKDIKFKYHLYEEGFLSKPAINLEKIKSFTYNITFNITRSTLQSIFKGSAFANNTNKIYFYTHEGDLKAELTDRARHNTDVFCLSLGEVDFNLQPIPLSLENIKLLSILGDSITFNINTEYGVSIVDIVDKNIKLKYILTSLTQ